MSWGYVWLYLLFKFHSSFLKVVDCLFTQLKGDLYLVAPPNDLRHWSGVGSHMGHDVHPPAGFNLYP